jgi:hypothetical protein
MPGKKTTHTHTRNKRGVYVQSVFGDFPTKQKEKIEKKREDGREAKNGGADDLTGEYQG